MVNIPPTHVAATDVPPPPPPPPPDPDRARTRALVDKEVHGSVGHIFLGGNPPPSNHSSWSSYGSEYFKDYKPPTGEEFKNYKPPTMEDNEFLEAIMPGENNASYKAALEKWKQTDPKGAAEFEKNVKEGLNGQDRKEWIVNNLQMAVHDGKITKQQAAELIGNGPAASLYDFSAAGDDHANAGAYSLYYGLGGPLGGDSADPWNEPIPDSLKPPVAYGDFSNPGKDNPGYKAAMENWKKKNPEKAAAFEKNIDEGNAGAKHRNKGVVNDLQMAVYRGEITKEEAMQLIRGGPAAGWFHFDSPGHNGTSAGAYALGNGLGGPLGGDSANPKAAGDKYIASQVFSLGGLLPNPISGALNPLGF